MTARSSQQAHIFESFFQTYGSRDFEKDVKKGTLFSNWE